MTHHQTFISPSCMVAASMLQYDPTPTTEMSKFARFSPSPSSKPRQQIVRQQFTHLQLGAKLIW